MTPYNQKRVLDSLPFCTTIGVASKHLQSRMNVVLEKQADTTDMKINHMLFMLELERCKLTGEM